VKVTFSKTEVRRYGVLVQRDKAPDLWMWGPGYDDDLPHDLLHFVAEAEFGLDEGVFGDVASGGNAGTFMPFDRAQITKLWRQKRMHKYVLRDGRRSEELAAQLERQWRTRTAPPTLQAKLDALAAQWRGLTPGGGLTLEWPRPEGRKRHPARDRRRPIGRR
jgi:hypothetical protein